MARTLIGIRVNETALEALDSIAEETGSNRSMVVRVLLGEAMRNGVVRKTAMEKLTLIGESA